MFADREEQTKSLVHDVGANELQELAPHFDLLLNISLVLHIPIESFLVLNFFITEVLINFLLDSLAELVRLLFICITLRFLQLDLRILCLLDLKLFDLALGQSFLYIIV